MKPTAPLRKNRSVLFLSACSPKGKVRLKIVNILGDSAGEELVLAFESLEFMRASWFDFSE
jgi:hypothetical protein